MLRTAFATAAVLVFAVSAFASPTAPKTPKKTASAAKSAPLICPVTGDKIASIKDAAGHSTYKGKTYYFCCASCKPEFDKNPQKYIKAASALPKGKPGAAHKM